MWYSSFSGLYGFIAGGRTYLVPHNAAEEAYPILLDGLIKQGPQIDEWACRALSNLRTKHFLSETDLKPDAEQPLPDLTTIRRFMGTKLRCNIYTVGDPAELALDVEQVEKQASKRYSTNGSPVDRSCDTLRALADQTASNQLLYSKPNWGHWLGAPLLTLMSPEHLSYHGSPLTTAFVVDLDNDTVALMERMYTSTGDGPWEVASCAQLSSPRQLSEMRPDLTTSSRLVPSHPFWQRLPTTQQQHRNISRVHQMGGHALRSFLRSPCAANLRRPPGFPLLIDEDRYPVDDELDLLEERYQLEVEAVPATRLGFPLPETQLEKLTRAAFEAQEIYDLTSEQLVNTAKSFTPSTTLHGDLRLTPHLYNLIINLKKTRKFDNKRISTMLGVSKSLVQNLTAGMPRAKRAAQR